MNRHQPSRRVDEPEPCFVRMRIAKGGPFVAARIFRVLGMLQAEVNGGPGGVDRVWTSGERIDEVTWRRLAANPPADPDKAVNWRESAPSF